MTEAPEKLRRIPAKVNLEILSPRRGAIMAAQMGLVFTRTTLVATEVFSRELIQVKKWRARKAPETTPRIQSFF